MRWLLPAILPCNGISVLKMISELLLSISVFLHGVENGSLCLGFVNAGVSISGGFQMLVIRRIVEYGISGKRGRISLGEML
jgi:hypothetical protein